MARVLSGIQPSGDLHLGNYLGAIRNWVADQDRHDAFYCVVDLHALTLEIDPADLRSRTHDTALDLLAAGLDPERCTLFVQSHVPEHVQMAWLLECAAAMGELERMTQFKDKGEGKESARVGLFTYPVLMAADIVLYDAERVPVGDDQRQHLELARTLATRFNHRFGDTLVVPEAAIPAAGARIMDLQYPERKMSKSVSSPLGTLLVLDGPDEITRKIKKAVTDTDGEVRFDPEHKPGLSNLLELLAVATDRTPEEVAAGYARYGDLKADTADALIELLRPLQARRAELAADPGAVPALLARGAEKASAVAASHLRPGRRRRRTARPGMTTVAQHGPAVGLGDGAAGPDGSPGRAAGSRARRMAVLSLRPVLLYLASRAGMLLVATAVSSDVHQRVVTSLTSWDSSWYLDIARNGYVTRIPPGSGNPAQSDLGFFPLVPLLTRATHALTGFGWPVSGLVTTFLLGLAAVGRRVVDAPRPVRPRRRRPGHRADRSSPPAPWCSASSTARRPPCCSSPAASWPSAAAGGWSPDCARRWPPRPTRWRAP